MFIKNIGAKIGEKKNIPTWMEGKRENVKSKQSSKYWWRQKNVDTSIWQNADFSHGYNIR